MTFDDVIGELLKAKADAREEIIGNKGEIDKIIEAMTNSPHADKLIKVVHAEVIKVLTGRMELITAIFSWFSLGILVGQKMDNKEKS